MAKKPYKEAEKKLKLPNDKNDKDNKNPYLENLNHTEEVNIAHIKMAAKYGENYIVITHFRDGSAISTTIKSKKKDKNGNEALPRVTWRIEDDYEWVGLREPTSSGTVV